jgi:serine/threonine-protein kinase
LAAEQLLAGPVEDRSMKSAFYQLGMELERKRHYSRALELYEHLLRFGRYRDVRQRVRQLRSAGALVTSDGEPQSAGTLVLTGGPSRPTFGRYEVVSELGQGAMGTVFLGKDPKINREVAIKTLDYQSIPPGELGDMKARFFREAEAAGKLSHPSIVTVFDVGEEHDMAYMAMERLDGEELTVWCTGEKRQPVNRVVAVMLTVAEALDYAHREGVVHRDIKTANIMVLKAGGVKVADFGIARIMDHSKTKTGIVMGTPTYMSPEQIAGKRVDGRSDLFSLGVVFYELLTGKRPFSGDSMTALMYAISKSPHTPILQVRPDLPECCAAVVERLLRKGVTRRFKNAGVLADTLRICCNDLGD